MILPVLDTDRLILRPRDMRDWDACIAMDRDPDVTRFIPGPWQDPPRHEEFLRRRMTGDFGPGLGYWSIFPRARPQDFHGWILLIPTDAHEIEIGWRLPRRAWGQGIATEAARAVAGHALTTLKLPRILAEIRPDNHGSRRVAEKIGMTPMTRGANAILFALTA